ncbi:hypothetical protein HAX54_026812 [Datura stramonium]|uniref:Uncharacterized protein n=1 Tax=Datura stramonium TaxID=4076 RepID=A0ABS8S873_DATST|nr:hypothetical protein [Datura stramonium]
MLVASLVSGFPLNIGAIIGEVINYRVVKLSTSLPFPCLFTRLYREAHVPILARIDVETHATKKYDLKKSKDESIYKLKLHKPIPKVFGPSGQNARATETSTELVGEATERELVDQAITSALELYKHLHAHMDDMEARVNDRLKDLIVPKLQGLQVSGASSSSAPPVERHVTGATIHSESTALATPLSAIEAAPHDPVTVIASTEATAYSSGVIPPQTTMPDFRLWSFTSLPYFQFGSFTYMHLGQFHFVGWGRGVLVEKRLDRIIELATYTFSIK